MTGDLNTANHQIINLGQPTNNENAASKEYVDTAISNVSSGGALLIDGSNRMSADLDVNEKGNKQLIY